MRRVMHDGGGMRTPHDLEETVGNLASHSCKCSV